jgi:thiol-disulfide isomerase/thioredoxin
MSEPFCLFTNLNNLPNFINNKMNYYTKNFIKASFTIKYASIRAVALFTIVNFCLLSESFAQTPKIAGTWLAHIDTDGGKLPFQIKIKDKLDKKYAVWAVNGGELLQMDDAFWQNDSLVLNMSVFDAGIVAKVSNGHMQGYWKRMTTTGKYISAKFTAQNTNIQRFKLIAKTKPANIAGTYSTVFTHANGRTTEAVGIFKQQGNSASGTFMTTTGDYRFLAGVVDGDSLKLSTYDGTHLFLFKAKKVGTQLVGDFWQNIRTKETWVASPNPKAKLPDAATLTYLKPGADKLSFTFPEPNGNQISLADARFQGKVTVLQILGTWCPNCMDESKFLAPWYIKNQGRGVEIIGLSFEKSANLADSGPRIENMKKRFAMTYPVVLAGLRDNGGPDAALPQLNHVLGFPTSLVLDKKGNVRHIHTGFAGPGTGKYYTDWVADFNALINKLLAE